MKPPYTINAEILRLVSSISIHLGEINALYLHRPSPDLRKQNRIKTIHSTLQIEGNTLTEEQVGAIIDNKRVLAPEKDILEVINTKKVYDEMPKYQPGSKKSFLSAHATLMEGLIDGAGNYRKKGVGLVQGNQVAHIAPPSQNVPFLMKDLFNYLKHDKDLMLIKSCVFHYEMEFIHPFMDGNGRMGRLWQSLILSRSYPVFEFLPFETLISQNQDQYYKALSLSDKMGNSTSFIEFILGVIDLALKNILNSQNIRLKANERLEYFKSFGMPKFSRKDYLALFKHISLPTASRDLILGVENGMLAKEGDKNQTRYFFI
jgi:Fic family protein